MIRCKWPGNDELYVEYHDKEWGVPIHDDKQLFERISLEGAQAGLSWITILRKRENYRKAFDGFDPQIIIKYDDAKVESLMNDSGIVRNRKKIESVITNAKAFIEIQNEFGTFDKYLWGFIDNKTIVNEYSDISQAPAQTDISLKISKDLKKRGFKFVGPTIIYAMMQAVGMVNDHEITCFRYHELKR